ncbi:coproporphyrinogen dehydrogenase HemZ [Pumilibacter intestinalis]|jgi:oxygen-independent coproporphyrinogen-3 oxidase|uniref:coproporphyrinogen dehydrogenase HemZ n=1 Tax=Pumilibacter intestinalis TaxID=2941511 RepID=UPI00204063A5|nr:coproporphyrinogen dehydrogenase HemZ [Pumilibacter intestinalis]
MREPITNRGDIRNELFETVRCFCACESDCAESVVFTHIRSGKNIFFVSVGDKKYKYEYALCPYEDRLEYVRYDLYTCKSALYCALSEYFGRKMPWGSLTGIRPTRVAARLLERGVPHEDIAARLCSDYFVSRDKAELTARIISVQNRTVGDRMSVVSGGGQYPPNNLVNLYVHIPFCPTRCAYCSFVSEGIEKKTWLLSPYAEALCREIRRTKAIIAEQNKKIFSVYIGGGTPTVLPPELLRSVLEAAYCEDAEYTCEAGRPDTIDEEKLRVMYQSGVNRISVNPQTLHDKTLQAIGRAHSSACFFEAYNIAARFGFVKNVDLIAGLEGETEDDFASSLCGVLALSPENITVHTLCLKRGSRNALCETEQNSHTEKMVNYSAGALSSSGYEPYYLYRQKQMTANLENIGWCKPNFLCVNNVTVMEETLPVYACGAGAISKLTLSGGRILRFANAKDVILYLREFEERIAKKELFYTTNC